MIDATGSPSPGRGLAAPGRDGRAVARLDASVPLSVAKRTPDARPLRGMGPGGSGPSAPARASGRARSWHRSSRLDACRSTQDARSPSSRSCASSRETRTARSAWPGRRPGREPASGCAERRRTARRGVRRRRREPVVHAPRRIGAGGPHRRPHRLRAERRLARRLPQRRRRRRGAAADRSGGHAAGHPAARQLGRRGRRALRALPLRLERSGRLDGRPGRAAPAHATATGSRFRTRWASTASTSTGARRPLAARLGRAYLELHIEQGPVLESLDLPLGVVLGTFGVERHRITWRGQAAHAGSTPMDQRRDALAGAAKLALEIREIAARAGDGAVCTSGGVVCQPGIVTSVVETAEQLLDQRHLDAAARRDARARRGGERAVRGGGVDRRRVGADLVDRADPLRRDAPRLADEAIRRSPARAIGFRPGPLHDAAEVSRARRPDRDAVRPEPPRPLAHEARGHAAGAPRARRRRTRPARVEDDRLGRGRRRALTSPVRGRVVAGPRGRRLSDVERVERRRGRRPARRRTTACRSPRSACSRRRSSSRTSPRSCPPGRGADRFGARRVALLAIAAARDRKRAAPRRTTSYELALVRAGGRRPRVREPAFVAGLDLVRAGGGGTALQGVYGGATMAGGGLALMSCRLSRTRRAGELRTGRRYSSRSSPFPRRPPHAACRRIGHAGRWVRRRSHLAPDRHPPGRDLRTRRRSRETGSCTLLEREGASLDRSGLAGRARPLRRIVTRPFGGLLAGRVSGRDPRGRQPRRRLGGRAPAGLSAAVPSGSPTLGALVLGLRRACPSPRSSRAAQQLRPDAPGAAIALVNALRRPRPSWSARHSPGSRSSYPATAASPSP